MWREFVELAEKREEPFAALCARFGVSRKTGYKWLNRFRAAGEAGLRQRSHRPRTSPRRTPDEVVAAVLAARRDHPEWSSARLHAELEARGVAPLPAPSTIDLILKRQREAAAARVHALGPEAQRFEPNYCWRFECGGAIALGDDTAAVPLVVRDEATDFWVGATLLAEPSEAAWQDFALTLLRRHGVPSRVRLPREAQLLSSGSTRAHSAFTVALMAAGVAVEFYPVADGPADDPEQRQLAARLRALPAYQRTALAELAPVDPLASFRAAARGLDRVAASAEFERVREEHNFGGRQEALQRRTPISLYRPSPRVWAEAASVPAYPPEAEVRLVSEKGIFTFQRRLVHVGRVFAGRCVELKLTPFSERFLVLYAGQLLGALDLAGTPQDATTSLPLSAP